MWRKNKGPRRLEEEQQCRKTKKWLAANGATYQRASLPTIFLQVEEKMMAPRYFPIECMETGTRIFHVIHQY